ncbi:hypothetical protein T05_681 [Trichinella murrelli]|uniref:Uncharacterized protein n=1 Tax=Trichinella murrelli TaxID=144512 RepID=A0A0V0TRY8_9BILA|nr:hypothetical protein T05_681 [Trichinella murrelli]
MANLLPLSSQEHREGARMTTPGLITASGSKSAAQHCNPNGKTVDRSQRMPLEDAGNLFGSQEGPSDLYLSGHSTPPRPRFQAPAAAHGIQHIRPASLFGPIHGKGKDLPAIESNDPDWRPTDHGAS